MSCWVTVDLHDWSRHEEVTHYAAANQVTIEEAIEMLVNAGLSHQPRSDLHSC